VHSTATSLNAALFFIITGAHFGLVSYWLGRRWGGRFASPEEWFFHSLVFGLGSLQAVLHLLACTVGIGYYTGTLALATLHLFILVAALWLPSADAAGGASVLTQTAVGHRRQRAGQGSGDGRRPGDGGRRSLTSDLSWPAILGAAVIAAIVLSWLWRSPESMQILGVDSRHYHAPYAIHYGHGVKLFDYLATVHVWAVGASILGSWFFQPFSNALLLDLTNLLPFVLLLASLVYLFRLLTDEQGWEWAPVVFLLLFTGKMFRVSLFISADLLYAAAFAALFVQLTAIWARNAVEAHEWWALALSTGMLLSSKIQGIVSAVLLVGFFALALAARSLLGREVPRFSLTVSRLAWCVVLLIASGGIWLIRNWWYFGSPLAPAGLTIRGYVIFPGPSGQGDWLSIATDMREIAGYNLAARFFVRAREWTGAWQGAAAFGLVALVADVLYQFLGRRRLSSATARKLFCLGFFTALFVAHAYILIFTIGTSIEILGGQHLRYIIPFFALFPLLAAACFVTEALPWARDRRVRWLVLLPALAYLVYGCNELSATPPQWNRSYGREDLLDHRWLPLAILLVLPWFMSAGPPGRRYARGASIALAGVFAVVLAARSASLSGRVVAEARSRFARAVDAFDRGAGGASVDDGVLYRAAAHRKRVGLACRQSRFFTLSRFDFPVALQDPDFRNLVFNVENAGTRRADLLAADGPGHGSCDYVVAVHTAGKLRGTEYTAIEQDEAERLLGVPGKLEAVGDSGLYRVYHVRPVRH
jgi:hypothetical protein